VSQGRCVDLADCRIDTTAAPGTAWPSPASGARLPDAVMVRGIAGGSFEQVTKRLGVLHALRELGVPVYNDARAIERSVDKSMTTLLLHAGRHPDAGDLGAGVGRPGAALVMRESAAGRALVLKPLFGSQGKGLQLVGRVNGVHRPLPRLERAYGGLAYLQRFVPPLERPGASTGACW
jgi:tetrahydromethanopterin:alpha-L-glutamate ligase